MTIKIDQQPSLIGIQHIPSKMRIKLNLIDNFKMESEFSRVYIESSQPRVQIDQDKIQEDLGYYKPTSFIKQKKMENFNEGFKKIKSIAKDKNILQAIANNGKPISEIVRQKVLVQKPEGKNIGFVPPNRPEIMVEQGQVKVEVSKSYLEVFSKPNFPQIDYKPGSVNVYLLQKGYVKVRFLGENVNLFA